MPESHKASTDAVLKYEKRRPLVKERELDLPFGDKARAVAVGRFKRCFL